MKIERSKNSIRNMFWGSTAQIIQILGPFLIRTIMISQLGGLYLGLNTLFSTILQVLNLSELGFSNAVVYCMYKPIADNDYDQLGKLLLFFKKVYSVIGILMLVVGCGLIPVLPHLISGEYPADINIYLVYLIYLFNAALSYLLFGYKSSLFQAYQRNDVDSKIASFTKLLMVGLQVFFLLKFSSYYLYLIVLPLTTLFSNIVRACVATKLFPNIIPHGKLDSETQAIIWKKVRALLIYKIGSTVSNSVDNIVISAFLGLSVLTMYNNYYYIISAIFSFLTVYYNSIKGGIGNSVSVDSVEKNINDFYRLLFLQAWLIGFCAISLVALYQPFMIAWVGKEYLLPNSMILLFAVYFYSWKIHDVVHTYKDALGLWNEDRYRPLISSIVNLVFNLALVRFIGLYGIVLSTIISELIFSLFWAPKVLFKSYFKCSIRTYYANLLKYTVTTVCVGVITCMVVNVFDFSITGIIRIDALLVFLMRAVLILIVVNGAYFLVYRNSEEVSFWKKKLLSMISKRSA